MEDKTVPVAVFTGLHEPHVEQHGPVEVVVICLTWKQMAGDQTNSRIVFVKELCLQFTRVVRGTNLTLLHLRQHLCLSIRSVSDKW